MCFIYLVASIVYGIFNFFSIKKHQSSGFIKKVFAFTEIVFALIALELGGSMMLGTCEEGIFNRHLWAFICGGHQHWIFAFGFGFATKMKAMNVESTIDLFEIKYRSPLIQNLRLHLSLFTVWGLLLGKLLQQNH